MMIYGKGGKVGDERITEREISEVVREKEGDPLSSHLHEILTCRSATSHVSIRCSPAG